MAKTHPLRRAPIWDVKTKPGKPATVTIRCDGCRKTEGMNTKINMPPDVVANKFRQRGWYVNKSHKRATCPECQKPAQAVVTAMQAADATPPTPRLVVVDPAPQPTKPHERPVTAPVLGKEAAHKLAAEIDEAMSKPNPAPAAITHLQAKARDLVVAQVDVYGKTQAQVADMAGVSPATIRRLYSNGRMPTRTTVLERVINSLRNKPMQPKPSAPQPTPATRKALRRVFALLEDHYSEEKRVYLDGWSDAKIAAETGVAVEAVAAHREDAFGPLTDPALERFEQRIAELEHRLTKDRDDAVELITAALQQAHDEISKLKSEVRALKNR